MRLRFGEIKCDKTYVANLLASTTLKEFFKAVKSHERTSSRMHVLSVD